MITLAYLLLGGVLSAIAWEDIQYRSVHMYWFVGLLIVLLSIQLGVETIADVSMKYLSNLSFLLVLFVLLHVYYAIRYRKLVWLMDRQIGWGDVVFLGCLSGVWNLPGFVAFIVVSLLFSLVSYLFFVRRYQETVPLAGLQAICFGIFYILEKNKILTLDNWMY